ncbi:MAG TPA: TIGR03621 family F420-dependent LLM class oxidoreductase [Jiangellaceae bacterium]|nr:TIGR03621 family F420-dependent LLM class oxidoreductase [Jiangellaceae bacterium]
MRHFRFGVIGESIGTATDLIDSARRAENLGYSTMLLRDHFVGKPFGHQFAPLIALTAVAAATSTLRVGTLVLANDYRHPVLLAKEAATLDVLSTGRFELGMGAGWLSAEYEAAGLPFDAPGVRVSRLEESIRLIKELFAGGSVTSTGDNYQVTELDNFPEPVQRPHPPLLIGAGSRRMLRLAGKEADVVGILPKALPDGTISADHSERTPTATAQKIAWIREGAGDRFDQIELSMIVSPLISPDHHNAAVQFATARGWGTAAADLVLEMPSAFVGPVERIVDVMQARREEYGFSYYVVSDRAMEEFAPVVDKLTGA